MKSSFLQLKRVTFTLLVLLLSVVGTKTTNAQNTSVLVNGQAASDDVTVCSETVSFDLDYNYNVSKVIWTFGDGQTGSGIPFTHQYDTLGDYTVSCDVYTLDSYGLDSLVETLVTELHIYESYETEFSVTSQNLYFWGDETYVSSGDYVHNFLSVHGCDSIVTLHLTITHNITAIANPSVGGMVTGAGNFNQGQTCILSATAAEGYEFMCWTDMSGTVVSLEPEYSFTVTEEMTFTAHFAEEGYCGIKFDLYDTYGDGWTNNYLIVNFGNGTYQELTLNNGLHVFYIIPIAEGSHVTLTWIDGNWMEECSYTVSYLNGNVIYQGANMSSNFMFEFDMDCEGMPETSYYNINVAVNPYAGGTVRGNGTYPQGLTHSISAVANDGYIFVNWTKNGTEVSTNTTYYFIVTENADYVANFTSIQVIAEYYPDANDPDSPYVKVYWSEEERLSEIFNDVFEDGLPEDWTISNDKDDRAGRNDRSLYRVYRANCDGGAEELIADNVTDNQYIDTLWSTIMGGNYKYGVSIVNEKGNSSEIHWNNTPTTPNFISLDVSAFTNPVANTNTFGEPSRMYHDNGWFYYDDGNYIASIGTSQTLYWGSMFPADSLAPYIGNNLTKVALYENNSNTGTIKVNIYLGGTSAPQTLVSTMYYTPYGGDAFHEVTLTTPVAIDGTQNLWIVFVENSPYPASACTDTGDANNRWVSFDGVNWVDAAEAGAPGFGWMIRGYVGSSSELFWSNCIENFNTIYSITASANPTQGGTVSGGGTFAYGQNCTLIATPNETYDFVNWTKNDTVVSTDANYSFTVTESANYVANFTLKSYNITVSINPTEGGTVNGDGTYNHGQNCTLIATPNETYEFVNWTKDGEEVSTEATYSFTVTEDAAFVANFTETQSDITQITNFSLGYNWWSSFIEQDGIDGLSMLQDNLGDNGITIRSQASGYNDYYSGYGWFGSLASINNESSYRVITNAPCTVTMTGNVAVPSQHPITLSQGWMWIGYVPSIAMDVNVAMAGLTPRAGDKLKSQQGYSDYYQDYGWFGSLNTIEPGMGLMYFSTNGEPVTFTYPDNIENGELLDNLTSETNHWVPNVYAYPDNMTVLAVVDLDNLELSSEIYELAAFDANENCRGSIKLTYAEPLHRYVAFLTISGEDAAELSFRLYNSETGNEYYEAEESLNFVANAIIGDANNLYVVHFRDITSVNEFANRVMVYPNPVAPGERLSINITDNVKKIVRVEILNVLGVVVETVYAPSVQTITAPNAAGIYTLRITMEGKETIIRKLVVK